MKLLVIAPMLPHASGPGAMPVLLHTQIHALADRHELTLLTGIGDESWETAAARDLVGLAADVHVVDRRRPGRSRQRMRRRGRLASDWVGRGRPWLTSWFAPPGFQGILDRLAATCRFDLVVVEDSSMATLRLPPAIPAVLTEHEVGRVRPTMWRPHGDTTLRAWGFRELDWRRWESFQRAAWHRYSRVQVFTEHDARTIATLAPDLSYRIRVNPFGVAVPDETVAQPEAPGSVLFIGNFTHPPNRDAALWLVREIMPRVRALYPRARLRLVGGAPPREVRKLAGPGVDVIADVPDVDPHLGAASVCVAPVRTGGGMRMKVAYALARGKPVVTTALGAEGYAQPGRQLPMVVADDAQGIAVAVAGLLEDESTRRELGRCARAYVQEFHSPRAWGARLDAVYEEARATFEPVRRRGARNPGRGRPIRGV